MFLVQNRSTLGFMTDRDKLFVYFRCGFKSLLIGEHTIDLSGSNQSVHGFLTRTVKVNKPFGKRISGYSLGNSLNDSRI